jgi:hypothetical protein
MDVCLPTDLDYQEKLLAARAFIGGSEVVADYLDAVFIRFTHLALKPEVNREAALERVIAIQAIKSELFKKD